MSFKFPFPLHALRSAQEFPPFPFSFFFDGFGFVGRGFLNVPFYSHLPFFADFSNCPKGFVPLFPSILPLQERLSLSYNEV